MTKPAAQPKPQQSRSQPDSNARKAPSKAVPARGAEDVRWGE